MIKLKDLILENTNDVFQMYHGGKRWSRIPNTLLSSKKGRYESGMGIYFTNYYNTARSYAKGSRVVHLVDIDKNFKDIRDVNLPLTDVINFIKNCPNLRHKKEIIEHIIDNAKRMERDYITADILNNLIVNFEAGSGNVGIKISNYFVSKGGDASLHRKSGDEFWLVVFNPNIIKKVTIINPSKITKEFPFELPMFIKEGYTENIKKNVISNMIKLKHILFETGSSVPKYVFHVTPKNNLQNIKIKGLLPNKPTDFEEDEIAVYLFATKNDAEDAIVNWLGDRYDDNVELVLLTIDTRGINLVKTFTEFDDSWEWKSYNPIPWNNIIKIEKYD